MKRFHRRAALIRTRFYVVGFIFWMVVFGLVVTALATATVVMTVPVLLEVIREVRTEREQSRLLRQADARRPRRRRPPSPGRSSCLCKSGMRPRSASDTARCHGDDAR